MTGAIFGLIGVIIGASISWFKEYWTEREATKKNARYLAIRVVCILDKFVEDCADVVKDDGLSFGQRDADGCLTPRVKAPGAPIFPEDVDWKSIEHELMYKILSFPSDVDAGDRIIKLIENISGPPDFEDWFAERRFHYSRFGLAAYRLAEELSIKYNIRKKTYNDWNPLDYFEQEVGRATKIRQKRIEGYKNFVNRVFGSKQL